MRRGQGAEMATTETGPRCAGYPDGHTRTPAGGAEKAAPVAEGEKQIQTAAPLEHSAGGDFGRVLHGLCDRGASGDLDVVGIRFGQRPQLRQAVDIGVG